MPVKQPHEVVYKKNISALIYGPPGVGKSTLGYSASKPLLIDTDHGYHRIEVEHQREVIQMESWESLQKDIAEGALAPYDTVIFDTASKLIDYLNDYLLRKNPKLKMSVGQLTLQGYGVRKGMFSNFIKGIKAMNKNVIFLAHEKEETDGSKRYVRPLVGGSSGNELFMDLDIIGYMTAIDGKRMISFFPTQSYYAKNSIGLKGDIEVPTLTVGQENDFFERVIMGAYVDRLNEKERSVVDYHEIISLLTGKIDSIENAAQANEAALFLKDFKEHKFDSLVVARSLFKAKIKSINLSYDKDTNVYTDPEPKGDSNGDEEKGKKSNSDKKESETKAKKSKASDAKVKPQEKKEAEPQDKTVTENTEEE